MFYLPRVSMNLPSRTQLSFTSSCLTYLILVSLNPKIPTPLVVSSILISLIFEFLFIPLTFHAMIVIVVVDKVCAQSLRVALAVFFFPLFFFLPSFLLDSASLCFSWVAHIYISVHIRRLNSKSLTGWYYLLIREVERCFFSILLIFYILLEAK